MAHQQTPFQSTDAPAPGVFEAMFAALAKSSEPVVGPANPHLLVIPIHDDGGMVRGGFWGWTMFEWLNVAMLYVPEMLQRRGIGSRLMSAAEQEARRRACRGAHLATFSFQAAGFYQKCGYSLFGKLDDLPPDHSHLYFAKRFTHET